MARIIGLSTTQKRLNEIARPGALQDVAYERIKKVWALAAQAFVRAATRRVLVETGMSAATFFPLSRAISQAKVGVVGTPEFVREALARKRAQLRRDRPEFPDGHRRNRVRSAAAGEREGKKAFRLNFGSARRPFLNFFFQTVVFQFAVNDNLYSRALQAGERAFREVIVRQLGPDVNQAIDFFLAGGRARALPPGDIVANDAGV